MGFNANDGVYSGGLCGRANPYTVGTGNYGSWSYESILGAGQVEAWHHYALVWNENGISGVLDGSKKLAVFLDGQLNSSKWMPEGATNSFDTITNGSFRLLINHLTQGASYIDNLKIWNYAKTNFADRFVEGDDVSTNVVSYSVYGSPSAYGLPQPFGYGCSWLVPGTVITNAVASPIPFPGGTNGVRLVSAGWTGTGSVTSGSGSNIVVTVTTNSSITWLWRIEYFLSAAAGSGGSVDVGYSWYTNGATVSISAVPTNGYRFLLWSGDIPSGMANDNPLVLTMDKARTISATFLVASTNALVASYDFSGDAVDVSGNGHNGTVYGATLGMDRFGDAGSAYSFDGTNDYVSVAHASDLNLTTALTVVAWVKADAPGDGDGWDGIVVKGNEAERNYGLGRFGNNAKSWYITGGLGKWSLRGKTDICDGNWHMVVTTWDGSNVCLYVDGKDDVNYADTNYTYGWTWNQPLVANNLPLVIGKVSDVYPFSYFNDGSIDEVKIYNRALSVEEVGEAYDNGRGLVLWNRFESYSNGVCASEVGSDLLVTGMPVVVAGEYNNGLSLSTSNFVYMDFNFTPEGCMEFWYKTPAVFDKFEALFWGPYSPFSFFLNHADASAGAWEPDGWNLAISDGVGGYIQTGRVAGKPVTSAWYHVASVWTTNGVSLYLNGQSVGGGIGRPNVPNQKMYFGVHLDGVSVTQWGSPKVFDNLKIWNYAKTNFSDRFVEGDEGDTNVVLFTVNGSPSDCGSPQPYGYGSYALPKGMVVTNIVAGLVSGGTGVQHVCTGWVGTGDVTNGIGTNVVVAINTNSSITWQWRTEYYLDTSAGSGGSVDVGDGWYTNGAMASISAVPTNGYKFLMWSGDVPSGMTTNNPLVVSMDTKRTITALFALVNAPTNGLVLWNRFESYSNGVCASEVGSDLLVTGMPVVVAGEYNNGLSLSTSNFVYMDFNFTPEGCMEFWYKTPAVFDKFEALFWGPYSPFSFFLNHADASAGAWEPDGWNLAISDGVGGYIQTGRVAGKPVTSAWYHVASVWTTNGVSLYLNGQSVGGGIGRPNVPNQKMYFGVHLDGVSVTQWGSPKVFDNLKIWNYAKTNFADRFEEGTSGIESNAVLFMVFGNPGQYGTPLPYGYATNMLSKGAVVNNSIASPVSGGAGIQYVCTGWTGSGDVTNGVGTNAVSVTVNTNSTITWQWRTEYYLDTGSSTGGCVDIGDGWYSNGATQTITAVPLNGWRFVQWTGDVPGGTETVNPVTLSMEQARAVSACFTQNTCSVAGQVFYSGTQSGSIYVEAFGDADYLNKVASVGIASPGAYSLTSLPAGANYWIRAYRDFNGDMLLSSTEPSGIYYLNPLVNLVASKGGVDITLIRLSAPLGLRASGSASCIELNWDANLESGIAGYNIYRFDSELARFDKLNGAPVSDTTYVDRYITTGQTYYYYITAVIQSEYVSSYMEGPASAIVGATAGTVTLWMPDYFGPTGSVVRLRVNTMDARGVLGHDMQIVVSYDPSILTPVSLIGTNPTVEKTVLTEDLVVSNSISAGQVAIFASGVASAESNVTLHILGCSYEAGPHDPVPVTAYYSTNGGLTWCNVNDGRNINDGRSYSFDLGFLSDVTNCLVWLRDTRNNRDRKSDAVGEHVKRVRNGDNLGNIPRYSQEAVVPNLSKYVDKDLFTHIGASEALYLFEFSDSTNEASSFQDVVVYLECNRGSSLVGDGHLFDVLFSVTNAVVTGTKCTNEFISVILKDCNGTPLSVDFSDKAVFTVQSEFILGDVNGDGVVNVSGDYTLAHRIAIGQVIPTEDQIRAGDIDGDGRITKCDATLIKRIAEGKNINPGGIISGGTGGDGEPGIDGYQLSIGSFDAVPGSLVQVPVLIDNAKNIASLEMRLNFDAQRLILQSVTTAPLTAAFGLDYVIANDHVDIVMSSADQLFSGNGAVLYLNFLVDSVPAYGSSSPITIAQKGLANQYGADLGWTSGITVSNGVVRIINPASVDKNGDGIPDVAIHAAEQSTVSNGFKLKWNTEAGKIYDVEGSTNLANGFFVITNDLIGSGDDKEFLDTNTVQGMKFYRIKVR